MQIQRYITTDIVDKVRRFNKAVVIYGPRQVGKTTLCKEVLKQLGLKTLFINADEKRYVEALSSRDERALLELVEGYELLFIDEAQRVPDIGTNLKILIDRAPNLKIIATGSSSFELANTISEPLTGRKWVFRLFPIAQIELKPRYNTFELKSQIEERLIYGSYPEIFSLTRREDKIEYLHQITEDYLFKDILALKELRNPAKIRQICKLLAFQVGNEVSLNEIATQIEMSKETVARYIDLLEKTFVIFSIGGFSRNLRKEVTKTRKIYFYDLGIRNALIDNIKTLYDRDDQGALWENFLMIERIKRNAYLRKTRASYFWRTYTGAEVDYVEEGEGVLGGFEFKWKDRRGRASAPRTWREQYSQASWEIVSRENWVEFVT